MKKRHKLLGRLSLQKQFSWYAAGLFGVVLLVFGLTAIFRSQAATLAITVQKVAGGFSSPVDIANSGVAGDSRLFIVEQGGVIKILQNGTLKSTPFLDISNRVSNSEERGLLGLVFHPSYASNRFFYVTYTDSSGALVVSRFTRSASNADIADNASEQIILSVPHPNFDNHNAGDLSFGPVDGYLYITTGDGGSGGDPNNNAQNKNSLLGKMLRIDVNSGTPYAIPPSNPFAGSTTGRDEIWLMGLRNPWRYSFDRFNRNLFIADVGQGAREEIDILPAGAAGGVNYGWRCYEGNAAYNTAGCASQSSYTGPIGEYDHANGRCAVIGGYVYRGSQYPAMAGRYFFGDYCSGHLYSLIANGSGGWSQELLTQLSGFNMSAFGEDINGEIYVANLSDGSVYHLGTTTQPPSDTTDPTASITAPTAGTSVSNTVTVAINASDNIGVTRVEFLVDGAVKASDTASPYSFSWDTKSSTNGSHSLSARAYDAAGNTGVSSSVPVTVNNAVSNPLPSPWQDSDVGTTGVAGSASFNNNVYTVNGAGSDIGGSSDGFHFVHQALNGDGQITARISAVENNDPNAKAGLMIRQDLNANSQQVSLFAKPASGGIVFQYRDNNGDVAVSTTAVPSVATPYWLRLQRQGSKVLAFWSSNGTDWNHVGSRDLSLSLNNLIGMAVTAHSTSTLNTSTFDNVAVLLGGNVPPAVDITNPGHNVTVKGKVNITATATDADGVSKVEFIVDGVVKATDTTAPFVYLWDTTTISNGTHTVDVKAYDTLGNIGVHNHITTVKNGDLNSDGTINILDLSILLSNYGKTTAQLTNPNADINGSGVVDILDLSVLLSRYGT